MSRDYVLHTFRAPIELQIDYARELNPQQFAAVTAPPGPALVIAGAGAGKTRTLIFRVAYLLEQGIPAQNILLLTFTNKAAGEMMRRVADLLGSSLDALWGGTFHAVGNRVLRLHAERLGMRPDFTILDREDATDVLAACAGEVKTASGDPCPAKPDVVAEMFSMAANMRVPVDRMVALRYPSLEGHGGYLLEVARCYAERKRQIGVVDFDDLLVLWLRLMEEQADVREHYQRRFQFILVDEYQDTNQLQSDLVDTLAARHHNLMVVGDDAQSIYSWRGANLENILCFADRHPKVTVYRIETNYRSTPEILETANAAIAPNTQQYVKQLTAVRGSGQRPVLVVCPNAEVQAQFVTQRVLELQEEGMALGHMAVLYRSHFHAMELQFELTRHRIPFSITSGIRFFEQAHIKDIAAALKWVWNPADEFSFKRLVRMLPGIGPKAAARLWTALVADGVLEVRPPLVSPVVQAAGEQAGEWLPAGVDAGDTAGAAPAVGGPACAVRLRRLVPLVQKKSLRAWAQFTATIEQVEAPPVRGDTAAMIRLLLEAFFADHVREAYTNPQSRLDELDQLATYGGQFAGPEEFLSQMALMSNLEAEGEATGRERGECLRLSSVHQAKGLEFDVVFVIMLCDGMFPSGRSLETEEGEEEERRLFYVAITRARNELYLSYPQLRTAGSAAPRWQQGSRFLQDIPPDLLESWNLVDGQGNSDAGGLAEGRFWPPV